ncbi:Uncharacterised protein [Nocardia otitidiscaviarum]|uniref:Rv3651-like N-terminal domain-containing protein n=1 Tax=Nocardia otitidiscaviarum TaxID=1823 RepID=A0A378Y7W8_9NOCA|nr:Uncharacterised protein [Nocardia otitidiscaviarum]
MTIVQPPANSTALQRGMLRGSNLQAIPGVGESGDDVEDRHLLVEALAGPSLEPTVLIDGEGPHRFHRLFRAFRGTGLAYLAPSSLDAGLVLLTRAVSELAPCHGELPSRQGPMPATCTPIVGPSGAVHAVRMTVGKVEATGEVPLVPLEFDASFIARFGDSHGLMPTLFQADTTWTLPGASPRKYGLNGAMPALISSSVGSSAISDAEGTTVWPRCSKNRSARSLISADFIAAFPMSRGVRR